MILFDRIVLADCADWMRRELPDGCIPLTVTSPPYDTILAYGGHQFDFEAVARELFRVTMSGGVVVWVVRDGIENGSETGTHCRQQLFFHELGFQVGRITLVSKGQRSSPRGRYGFPPQIALVLSKGKPRHVNLLKKRNKTAGRIAHYTERLADGTLRQRPSKITADWSPRGSVWDYAVGGCHTSRDRYVFQHPAVMPEAMAEDCIVSWSRPSDIVFDPMCGAATTCKMALLNNRHYLGTEVHEPYYQLALRRMEDAHREHRRRLDTFLVG